MHEEGKKTEVGFQKQQAEIVGISDLDLYFVPNFDLLAENIQSDLFQKTKVLIRDSFGQDEKDPSYDEDVLQFLRHGEMYVITHGDELIGMKHAELFRFEAERILYLPGAAYSPSWQGKGINSKLTDWLIKSRHADYIVGRTQNPNIYRTFQGVCTRIWPQLDEPTPSHIQDIGMFMAQKVNGTLENFDQTTLVGKGTYGSTLYDTVPYPQSRSSQVNSLFVQYLNVERGDSMLVIGEVNAKE